MAIRIFLSHSSRDRQWIQSIRSQADAVGVDVYLFDEDLHPGENTALKLQRALEQCQALLVLITANSVLSPYVNQEIGLALGRRMPVIPLVETTVTPDRLAMLQGVDYIPFDRDDVQAALTQLTRTLREIEQNTPAPQMAAEKAVVQVSQQDIVLGIAVVALLVLLAFSAGAAFGRP